MNKSNIVILSHRGYWKRKNEKNAIIAFKRAFSLGFGAEFDIRDFCKRLVVSHNLANVNSPSLEHVFKLYKHFNMDFPLALNIKADGLEVQLNQLLHKYKIHNYFVFDLSVPSSLLYLKRKIRFFTRQSEYENNPLFYSGATGIWMDEFESHWVNKKKIIEHLKNGKEVCIVSPELHGREYLKEWEDYKIICKSIQNKMVMLCTDFPEKARQFFYE
jgi:hypothetical protein